VAGRPAHGGRDRHIALAVNHLTGLKQVLDQAGVAYTLSHSGRPALFCRDPDGNAIELIQQG
jgi:glyoxylase I family protein